jgi:hypothetical protein
VHTVRVDRSDCFVGAFVDVLAPDRDVDHSGSAAGLTADPIPGGVTYVRTALRVEPTESRR